MKSATLSLSLPRTGLLFRALAILIFTLATALAAHVKIPVPGSLVPMTLQTAIVLLAGLRLGARDGAISQVLYILGGTFGLPFFAGGASGLLALIGPTGGYLIGFALAAWTMGLLKPFATTLARTWILVFAASLIIFATGMAHLKIVTGMSWEGAFVTGVVPFIIGDFLKVSLAAVAHCLSTSRR